MGVPGFVNVSYVPSVYLLGSSQQTLSHHRKSNRLKLMYDNYIKHLYSEY